jgi:hypothetical protein
MTRNLLILGAFGIGLWLAAAVYLSGREDLPPPTPGMPAVFNGGEAAGRRIDSRSWSAQYDKIVANADQTQLDLEGVHNGIIYKQGKPYLYVRAKFMSVNTVTHDFVANGPIFVESATPPYRTFETTSASWSDTAQRLSLPQRIVIHTGAREPLVIGSMDFDVRTGQIDLKRVSGAVRFK